MIEIYYFSGTGNCLKVARGLEERLEEVKLIPIASIYKKNNRTTAESVGFVFPIYINSIPAHIRDFIERLDMSSAEYVFFVPTFGGAADANIQRGIAEKLLSSKNKLVNLYEEVEMTFNSPTGLMPTFIKGRAVWLEEIEEKKVQKKEKAIPKQLDRLAKKIQHKKGNDHGKSDSFKNKLTTSILMNLTKSTTKSIKYFADETCVGCGTCAKVCPSGKVKMKGSRPKWQENKQCYYCYACFNFCPEQAILVPNWKRKDGRYTHPDATIEQMAAQKKN